VLLCLRILLAVSKQTAGDVLGEEKFRAILNRIGDFKQLQKLFG
jgi:hypothetical protein